MPKAKVGDRIRIVNALMSMGEYEDGYEGKVTALCHEDPEGVMVLFDHYEEGEGSMYVLGEEYEVIPSKEGHPRKTGDVPKAGDKVRLVNKPIWVGAYKEGDIGVVVDQRSVGFSATFGYVLVALDNGVYSIPPGQYEVIENDADTSFPERKEECHSNKDVSTSSAEAIRDNILRIREKRNNLKMEIIALDEEEAELVEKLKQQGFVLYEQNVPEKLATEKKTVLYADDIEEDMTDPKNWKVGDCVEVAVEAGSKYCKLGDVFEVVGIESSGWIRVRKDSMGLENTINPSILKFHSRPL